MTAPDGTVRPLSKSERRLLESKISALHQREKQYRVRSVKISLALWGGASGLTLLANPANRTASGWPVVELVWGGIALLMAVWLILKDRRQRLARIHSIRDALYRSEAHVVRIRSDAVVEFEEEEDEGACYAFQAAENIVFISGQEFYPSAKFPNTDFSLVQIRDRRGAPVESLIATDGKRLQPIRTIPAELKAKLRVPEHLQVLEGKLDDLDRLLAE